MMDFYWDMYKKRNMQGVRICMLLAKRCVPCDFKQMICCSMGGMAFVCMRY